MGHSFHGRCDRRNFGGRSNSFRRLRFGLLAFFQIVEQFPSTLIAFAGILGEGFHDEIAENGMEFGIQLLGRNGSAFENALAQSFRVFAVEGSPIGDHFVKQSAETEQVGACVDIFAAHLFG